MSLYSEQVVPRVLSRIMDDKHMREARARVCAGLTGTVLEVGFGTGLNLPFLPPAVTQLIAVEPSPVAVELAGRRIRDSSTPVEILSLDEQLRLEAGSVDSALMTWTLCSVDDPVFRLREIYRVLRPGGELHFVEHGLSTDPRVNRWQHRLTPLHRRLVDNCHLDRGMISLLKRGGFHIQRRDWEFYYAKGKRKTVGATYEGVATAT